MTAGELQAKVVALNGHGGKAFILTAGQCLLLLRVSLISKRAYVGSASVWRRGNCGYALTPN